MGNFLCVDENPLTAVSRVATYAIHAHAKDMLFFDGTVPRFSMASTRGGNYFKGTVIGEGNVPVLACLRALKKAKYDGFLSIEYEGGEDCITSIAVSKENLEKYLELI